MGNVLASREVNFVSATMFYEVGKQENIDRKHNVFAMFYTLYYKSIRFILPPTNKFIAILTSYFLFKVLVLY